MKVPMTLTTAVKFQTIVSFHPEKQASDQETKVNYLKLIFTSGKHNFDTGTDSHFKQRDDRRGRGRRGRGRGGPRGRDRDDRGHRDHRDHRGNQGRKKTLRLDDLKAYPDDRKVFFINIFGIKARFRCHEIMEHFKQYNIIRMISRREVFDMFDLVFATKQDAIDVMLIEDRFIDNVAFSVRVGIKNEIYDDEFAQKIIDGLFGYPRKEGDNDRRGGRGRGGRGRGGRGGRGRGRGRRNDRQ